MNDPQYENMMQELRIHTMNLEAIVSLIKVSTITKEGPVVASPIYEELKEWKAQFLSNIERALSKKTGWGRNELMGLIAEVVKHTGEYLDPLAGPFDKPPWSED